MHLRFSMLVLVILGLCLCGGLRGLSAHAQIDPVSGVDFVTVTRPGNPPWPGRGVIEEDPTIGRGTVNYDYRIGRTEVTTAQWVEFMNASFDRPGGDATGGWLVVPNFWGAIPASSPNPGGRRWSVPAGRDNVPVGNISWRAAAIYCNWLHNGKSLAQSAFMAGAYDVSTFGTDGVAFTDQLARSPGARYFIPTWDEWLKAVHWDPNKTDRGGWWVYPNASDTPLVQGPPGVGQTSGGFADPSIPLMSYPSVQSPWGLFDASGGMKEWNESYYQDTGGVRYRLADGSCWADSPGVATIADQIRGSSGGYPWDSTGDFGFRLGAVVPTPSAALLLTIWGAGLTLSRRRSAPCATRSPTSSSP